MPHPHTPDLFADPALGVAVCRQLDHGVEQDLFAVAARTVDTIRQEIETVAKQARAEYDRLMARAEPDVVRQNGTVTDVHGPKMPGAAALTRPMGRFRLPRHGRAPLS